MNLQKALITIASFLLGSMSVAHPNITINNSGGFFESLEINQEITFTVTSAIDDLELFLVLNDVYASDTFHPNEDFEPVPVNVPSAIVNGTDESNHTFAWLVRESQWDNFGPFSSGYDPQDLAIVYGFENAGFSAEIGDTITLNIGTVFRQAGLDLPELNNLGSTVTAHMIAGSFDQRLTNDLVLTIIPEASFALPVSLLCLAYCGSRRTWRRRSSHVFN